MEYRNDICSPCIQSDLGIREDKMPEKTCPVTDIIAKLSTAIDSGILTDPRSRRRAEDILALLNDVAWGRADTEHLPTMKSLA